MYLYLGYQRLRELLHSKAIDEYSELGVVFVTSGGNNGDSDFHIKPVWDGKNEGALAEIMECDFKQAYIKEKVWFMPAGDSREALFKSYPVLFDWVRDNGYRMTWRPHIIAFEDQREV